MILTRVNDTFIKLVRTELHFFCKRQASSSSKMFIKNDNLTYEDAHHKLTTYFFLPEMRKLQNKAYDINKYSNVLSFVWSPRKNKQAEDSQGEAKKGNQEQIKLSFSFRYHQLQALMQVAPTSGATTTLERKRTTSTNQVHQTLTLTDNPQQKCLHYNFNSIVSTEGRTEKEAKVNFEFAYCQYRIFDILLRKSLFELSGMGLLYEIKREQEINSAENEQLRMKNVIEKEAEQFYK